jgi:competence protein ComEC
MSAKSYVAIIDVGHGNCTAIHDNGETIIVDCGRGASLLEFLTQEEIRNVDSVFLSHADADHIGGLINMISSGEFSIGSVYVNSDSTKSTKTWADLLYELDQSPDIVLFSAISTSVGPFRCGKVELKVVGPSPYLATKSPGGSDRNGRTITSNSISASFQVICQDQVLALLAGDIDLLSLDDILSKSVDIRSPLLVFPHHGGRSNDSDVIEFTQKLIDQVKPSTVVFSIGRRKHTNPRPEVVKAVRELVPSTRIACTQLSRHCAVDLPKNPASHLVTKFSQGKAEGECCSGTFIIDLEEKVEHLPTPDAHRNFIRDFAPTSLCLK